MQLQLDMKRMSEQQSEALADVGAWLNGAGAAEEEMLRRRRAARARPAEAPAVRAVAQGGGAGSPAAAGAAPLGGSVGAPKTADAGAAVDPLDALHEDGNAAMGAGLYARAVGLYTRVLCGRPHSTAALANRSLAHLKLRDHCACIADATLALRQDPAHVKCWLRRATARNALGQHAFALSDLEVASALDPTNKTAQAELRKTAEMVKACRRRRPEMVIRIQED